MSGASFFCHLEAGTAQARQEAEGSPLLRWLAAAGGTGVGLRIHGCVQYLRLLAASRTVHVALEQSLGRSGRHPLLRRLQLPEACRARELTADLWAFAGDEWPRYAGSCRAASLWTARLCVLEQEAPLLLAAHLYVRYHCDLVHGVQREALVRAAFELEGEEGRALFLLPGAPEREARRERLQQALDALPLQAAQVEELVSEARLAFRLERRLHEELARNALGLAREPCA